MKRVIDRFISRSNKKNSITRFIQLMYVQVTRRLLVVGKRFSQAQVENIPLINLSKPAEPISNLQNLQNNIDILSKFSNDSLSKIIKNQ